MTDRYNLRVYGIIMNSSGDVLVSDERRNGVSFTKFPGGGLEFGEGLADCLKREIKEELGVEAEIGELFYVNDFFQASAFRETDQLISFYYGAFVEVDDVPVSDHEVPLSEEGEKFRWVRIADLTTEMMTFPIDKKVVELLKEIEV
ncbi:MAG: NUDIX hydrolase [Crocinitomicaceae bacterium]